MQDLISVVVPVYNCAPYLDACLQSLQAQTWQNWEAVLVDDGSTDGSSALCDTWAQKDPRIRVLHRQNAGVSAARNAGIEAVRGDYLAFVDADDRVEPEFLQILYQTIGNTQLAVCCVFDPSDWNEKVLAETVSLDVLRTTPSRYANPVYTNYPCNKLFLTELICQNRLTFPVGVRRCEDAYFVQDYLLCCKSIAVTTKKLYHYDQHEGSAMHRFYAGVCDDELPLMERQFALFHPIPLQPEEETAYSIWEFGKILSVCRYIKEYAESPQQRQAYLRRWITHPVVWNALRRCPAALGKKAGIIRLCAALGLRTLCLRLMTRFC